MTFDLDPYLQGHSALTLKIVSSLASTVLDGFFPYLVQMISSMRRCVACDDLRPWPISSRSFNLDFENRVRSVTFSVLDRLFFWLGIQYDSIMWVIMRRRGVFSERRRSSYSSWFSLRWRIWLVLDEFINAINQSGFQFDSWNLQNSCITILSQMVLHVCHVG